MKNHFLPAVAAIVLALMMTGCETDGGVSARKQEKSAAYATARTWQKSFIDQGVVANGFTPDLVYITMGKPDHIETRELPEGHAEMWTYSRYYPNVDAVHGYRSADFSTESAYQPQRATTQLDANSGLTVPMGMSRGGGDTLGRTGGAQGGSMEPADLRSYTVKVLFANGKVVRIGADMNL